MSYTMMPDEPFALRMVGSDDLESMGAFADLLRLCDHPSCYVDQRSGRVWVEKGFLLTDVRWLSERWKWGPNRVQNWLKRSAKLGLITLQSSKKDGTLIGVAHWWKDPKKKEVDTRIDTQSDTEPDTQLDTEIDTQSDTHIDTQVDTPNKKIRSTEDQKIRAYSEDAAPPQKRPARIRKPEEPKKNFGTGAPNILLTESDFSALVARFSLDAVKHYLPICSDWLKSPQKRKDHRDFMARWIQKDKDESRGFYYPKDTNGGSGRYTNGNANGNRNQPTGAVNGSFKDGIADNPVLAEIWAKKQGNGHANGRHPDDEEKLARLAFRAEMAKADA